MKKYFFYAAIFLIIYYISAAYNTADWDLWHRLAAGKLFFENGAVPMKDVFAYTPTKELWIDHEWGSGAIFYFLYNHFGGAGLGVLKCLLLLATFLPVFLLNRLKGDNSYRILFFLLFFYGIMFGFLDTIRSQAFTLAFFAIWLYLLELVRRGHNRLLLLFPLMTIFWANVHGGFIAGLGILVLYGIGEIFNWRNPFKYFLTAAASGSLTILNPYGTEYWNYLKDALTLERTFITEWQPLNLFGPINIALGFKVFLLMTVLALPYVFVKKRKDINWGEFFILAVTCYLSLKHIRHNVFFVIAAAAYMQEHFYSSIRYYFGFVIDKIPESVKDKIFTPVSYAKNFVIYTLILFIGLLTLIFVPLKLDISEKRFPVKSVEYIRQNGLNGNLLVLFNWGSYALWELYPQCKVAIDGRYEEVYKTDLVNESARFQYLGKDWIDFMKNYKTDIMLIDKSHPVFAELITLDNWRIVHQDELSAVFLPVIPVKEQRIIIDQEITPETKHFEPEKAVKESVKE